jgi:hypothetical protein
MIGEKNNITLYPCNVWNREMETFTYRAPAPTGAIDLKNDIAVVAIPFAVPLCSWHWNLVSHILHCFV